MSAVEVTTDLPRVPRAACATHLRVAFVVCLNAAMYVYRLVSKLEHENKLQELAEARDREMQRTGLTAVAIAAILVKFQELSDAVAASREATRGAAQAVRDFADAVAASRDEETIN